MSLPVKIAANTFVQILGRIITGSLTLAITILIAHRFGVTGFGDFTKITTFVAVFYLVADFGFNAIFLRDYENRDFKKLLGTRILFASLLIIVAILLSLILPADEKLNQGFTSFVKLGIIIYSFTILTQAVFTSCNAIFQKKLRYDFAVMSATVSQVVTFAVVLILLAINSSLVFVLLAFLVGGIIMAATSLAFVKKDINKATPFFDWRFIKSITVKTVPLGATLVFNIIYFRIDSFLLTILRSTSEVGIYGLAFKFFEFPIIIPTFFSNSIYPLLLKNRNNKNLRQLIVLSSAILLPTSLLLLLVLWLAAPLFVLINKDFISSILPFRILILSLPFFFLSSIYQWGLVVLNRQKILAFIYFISLVFNIVLNLLFIPKYSYMAASIITVVSEALVLFLMLIVILMSLEKVDCKPKTA